MTRPRHMAHRRDMFADPIYRATHFYPNPRGGIGGWALQNYPPKHRREVRPLLPNLLRTSNPLRFRKPTRVFSVQRGVW